MTLLAPQAGAVVHPMPSELTQVFWDGCRARRAALSALRGVRRGRLRPGAEVSNVPLDGAALGVERGAGHDRDVDGGVAAG